MDPDSGDAGTDATLTPFLERATPPGSIDHYAVLFSPPEARTPLAVLLALHGELRRAGQRAKEPELAALKLQWWAEELDRLLRDTPRHPLTSFVHRLRLEPTTLGESLADMLHAAHMHLDTQGIDSVDALRSEARTSFGALHRLMAVQLGSGDGAIIDYARALGGAIGLAQRAISTGPEHGALVETASADIAEARLRLPPEERVRQRTGLVYMALYAGILKKLARGAAPPGPMSRLWTGWAAARRALRGRLP